MNRPYEEKLAMVRERAERSGDSIWGSALRAVLGRLDRCEAELAADSRRLDVAMAVGGPVPAPDRLFFPAKHEPLATDSPVLISGPDGAKGDGITDDRTAFESAIASAISVSASVLEGASAEAEVAPADQLPPAEDLA